MQTTTIRKWGNSYAIRLPRASVEKLNLVEGQSVRLEEIDDGCAIKVVPATRTSESLSQLLSRITPENTHEATDWGEPVGKELW
jgi:antitoxin MazE